MATLAIMPSAKTFIEVTDVYYGTTADDNAETGSWYDYMYPSTLVMCGGMPAVAAFMALTPGSYVGADTGKDRKSTAFECILDQMVLTVMGRKIADNPQPAQAAAIARALADSQPPQGYPQFIHYAHTHAELERRSASTISAAFVPLLRSTSTPSTATSAASSPSGPKFLPPFEQCFWRILYVCKNT